MELIETLWNVNFLEKAVATLFIDELIETLWNVNAGHSVYCKSTIWN